MKLRFCGHYLFVIFILFQKLETVWWSGNRWIKKLLLHQSSVAWARMNLDFHSWKLAWRAELAHGRNKWTLYVRNPKLFSIFLQLIPLAQRWSLCCLHGLEILRQRKVCRRRRILFYSLFYDFLSMYYRTKWRPLKII